jgi:hypothetical protein
MPLRPRSGQDFNRSATTSNTGALSLGERLAQAVTRPTGSTASFSIALAETESQLLETLDQSLVDVVSAEQFSRSPS